jgi:hypothetical protein
VSPDPGDDETADVRWATFDEALTLGVSSGTRQVIESIAADRALDP